MQVLIDSLTTHLTAAGIFHPHKQKAHRLIFSRRYAHFEKEAAYNDPGLKLDGEQGFQFFIQASKRILTVFFEERAEEVTAAVIDKWIHTTGLNHNSNDHNLKHEVVHEESTAIKNPEMTNKVKQTRAKAESSLKTMKAELDETLHKIKNHQRREKSRSDQKHHIVPLTHLKKYKSNQKSVEKSLNISPVKFDLSS